MNLRFWRSSLFGAEVYPVPFADLELPLLRCPAAVRTSLVVSVRGRDLAVDLCHWSSEELAKLAQG